MAYTTINKSSDYFSSNLYTGTGNALTVTTGHQSDLIWIKQRTTTRPHCLFDSVNSNNFAGGNSKYLVTHTTAALTANNSTQITANSSTGFTIGTDNTDQINKDGDTTVAWSWKANGLGSSNTAGSINTTYTSANATAGCSIIKYTGNGSAGATIGHGLGKKPEFIIFRRTAQAENWGVYLKPAEGASDFKRIFYLNTAGGANVDTAVLNNTEPSSSLITLGTSVLSNANGNPMIAYAFAPIKGFSRFGKYTGNGSADGPFVFTGFKPAFIIFKANTSANWWMFDSKRSPFNIVSSVLLPDNSAAETSTSAKNMDFLSNGFKIRNTTANDNGNGTDYYYMAFAEAPLVGTNDVPANAR